MKALEVLNRFSFESTQLAIDEWRWIRFWNDSVVVAPSTLQRMFRCVRSSLVCCGNPLTAQLQCCWKRVFVYFVDIPRFVVRVGLYLLPLIYNIYNFVGRGVFFLVLCVRKLVEGVFFFFRSQKISRIICWERRASKTKGLGRVSSLWVSILQVQAILVNEYVYLIMWLLFMLLLAL